MARQYTKPLAETRKVDRWKCPWCRAVHDEPEWQKQVDTVFHEEYIGCPDCGKTVLVSVSPMFIAVPVEDE
ncbi:hypothetical protein [Brevibacillus fulvus]|uniref:Uncharacterized protein n=1 Tax=Brevibacillus fulvus TaxID=1125967 RepID=A0A938Y1I1_9BACL|nr:hypothetical protein [Brevibacillus fulvus]MBM7592209.1 hypothetical protein [Brevibacillus fulvus]